MNGDVSIEELSFYSRGKRKDLFTELKLLDLDEDVSVLPVINLPLCYRPKNNLCIAVFMFTDIFVMYVIFFVVVQLFCSVCSSVFFTLCCCMSSFQPEQKYSLWTFRI